MIKNYFKNLLLGVAEKNPSSKLVNLFKKNYSGSAKKYYGEYLKFLEEKDLYPAIYTVDGPSAQPEVIIKDKKYLNFSSNNYIGLAGNEKIKEVVIENIRKYGVGSGSTRLLSGTLDIQLKLEKKLTKWLGKDDSITFSSGFLANIGVIRMLVDSFPYFTLFNEGKGIIISDELNHASIIDGVRLAKSDRAIYKHNDMNNLERILQKSRHKRKLILTDGVFSMDGDMAKLKEIVELAKKYNSLIMIDDAHGQGVLGLKGAGTAHHLGVEKDIDVIMGSFTKSFGSIGVFIGVNKSLADYLRITARSYIFSDPIIPAVVAGLIKTTEIIENGDDLRKSVLDNSEYLRTSLKNLGFIVLGHETSIVPLFIGNEEKAIRFSAALYENDILAPCIRRPAVVLGKERIRFSLMASHKREQVDILLGVCEKIGKELGII